MNAGRPARQRDVHARGRRRGRVEARERAPQRIAAEGVLEHRKACIEVVGLCRRRQAEHIEHVRLGRLVDEEADRVRWRGRVDADVARAGRIRQAPERHVLDLHDGRARIAGRHHERVVGPGAQPPGRDQLLSSRPDRKTDESGRAEVGRQTREREPVASRIAALRSAEAAGVVLAVL